MDVCLHGMGMWVWLEFTSKFGLAVTSTCNVAFVCGRCGARFARLVNHVGNAVVCGMYV